MELVDPPMHKRYMTGTGSLEPIMTMLSKSDSAKMITKYFIGWLVSAQTPVDEF